MKEKKLFYCEAAYAVGTITLALGTALMEKANFGLSMVVAPAYLLHLKVSEILPFFSFGVAEYAFQAIVLIILSLVMRRLKRAYFLSFATAIIYGTVLDLMISTVSLFPYTGTAWRLLFYVLGMVICAIGVAFFFRSYFPPAAYELFVKEISAKYNAAVSKTKTVYDCCSCVLAIVLSLLFFGRLTGIGWGTIACALVNGYLIGKICNYMDKSFNFEDAFPLRAMFEQ